MLELLAIGRNNQRIADELGLKPQDRAQQRPPIFTKLRVADRARAMLKARASSLCHDG